MGYVMAMLTLRGCELKPVVSVGYSAENEPPSVPDISDEVLRKFLIASGLADATRTSLPPSLL
jgi:hypothetical protein